VKRKGGKARKMKNKEYQKINNEKGITLVALVVTIVVLLILATVTINMTMNSNGIFGRAKNATATYKQAEDNETAALNDISTAIDTSLGNQTAEIKVADSKGGDIISSTDNTAIKDDNGNTVTIPAGFKIASDSATKQEDGVVIEDKDGNQYVWIPVSDIANYKRTDYGKQSGNYSDYSEEIPVDEQTSVNTYHGYYIGRYEAGDSVSTASKTLRVSGASVTNKVLIKKGQAPYNFVTRDQANTLATGIKAAEGYSTTTKLCSSYAWDTTINFIQNKISNYGTTSSQGNYNDTTFTYTDITGATQTKANGSNVLIPTGNTTPVCNIYDMGGNDWEWTKETSSVSGVPCVCRGGLCFNYYSTFPAGYRGYGAFTYSIGDIAFRATLYM
jgi:type II secretory pathway pseudopilin PulG